MNKSRRKANKIPMPVILKSEGGRRNPYKDPPLLPGHHALARAIAKLVLDEPAPDKPATPAIKKGNRKKRPT